MLYEYRTKDVADLMGLMGHNPRRGRGKIERASLQHLQYHKFLTYFIHENGHGVKGVTDECSVLSQKGKISSLRPRKSIRC